MSRDLFDDLWAEIDEGLVGTDLFVIRNDLQTAIIELPMRRSRSLNGTRLTSPFFRALHRHQG